MRLQADVTYPADALAVARMLADPAFVDARDAATHPVARTCAVEGSAAEAFTVRSSRTMPTGDFPQVARRFVGDTVELRQVDAWGAPGPDGARAGTMVVEVVGTPVVLRATLRLDPAGDGAARERVDGELRAAVPLVGGALERAAEPAVRAAIRSEARVGRAWLADRPD